MTRKQNNARKPNWKEVLAEQEDFLRPLIQEVVQQVLEAEMEEALGAGKGERTASRQGYRSGYYGRTLSTRVGKLPRRPASCSANSTDGQSRSSPPASNSNSPLNRSIGICAATA